MLSTRRLLTELIVRYGQDNRPCSPELLAENLDADVTHVREQLESLQSYELVRPAPDASGCGYVPTITAYELLVLDPNYDGFVIIDVPDESQTQR